MTIQMVQKHIKKTMIFLEPISIEFKLNSTLHLNILRGLDRPTKTFLFAVFVWFFIVEESRRRQIMGANMF